MAKVNTLVIVLIIIVSMMTTASAAEINKNNRNLQFHKAGTVSAFALGGSAGVGGRLDYNKYFGTTRLIWGASAEVLSSKDFGAMSSAELLFGYKIGGKFAFTPSVLAGYGQYGMMQDFTNGANASYYKTTTPWTPFVGGEFKISADLGRVDVSIIGGYKVNFQQASSDAVPNGWTEHPRTHNNKNWYVGAGLAFDLNKNVVQGGGDRTFYSEGFAVIDNGGFGGGVELGHFGARHAMHGWEKGVRSTWISNSGYTENEISAFFGWRWLPMGAQSPLSLSLGAQVGIGNLACAFKAETSEGEFSHVQQTLGVFGGSAGLYTKLALRISRRFELVAGAYAKGVLANKFEAGGDKGMAVVEYTRPDVFRYGATIGLGFYF